MCVYDVLSEYFISFFVPFYILMSSVLLLLVFFYHCIYDFGKGLWHFSAWSAFYMGKLSPTCSCFKSPIVLRFLSIVYDVRSMAATAACQHYFSLIQRNWNPECICHQS